MPRRIPCHRPPRPARADTRPSAAARGYDWRWQKYARMYLKRPDNVLCRITPGCNRPATLVDHIVPHKGDYQLFWDPDNHQPGCKPCHDRKTALEDGGFG